MDEKKHELRTNENLSEIHGNDKNKTTSNNKVKLIHIDKNSFSNNNFIKEIIAQSSISSNNKENSNEYDIVCDNMEKEKFKFPNSKNKNMNMTIKKSNVNDKKLFLNDFTYFENKSKKVNEIIEKFVLKDPGKNQKVEKGENVNPMKSNIKFNLSKKKSYGSIIKNERNEQSLNNNKNIKPTTNTSNNNTNVNKQSSGVFSFLKKLIFGAEVEEKVSEKSSIYSDQISKDSKNVQKETMSISNNNKNDENILINFIPCMMCGDIININDVEEHSDKCNGNYDEYQRYDTKYSTVLSVNNDLEKKVSSSNIKSIKNLNNKLMKIYDHIQTLGNFNDEKNNTINKDSKDSHLLFLLSQSIKDTAMNDNHNYSSISSLKKILINIDVSRFF